MGIKGIQDKHIKQLKENNRTPASVQPVPLNKVGEYCKGADKNITLPIEFNDVKTLAKSILEKVGKIPFPCLKFYNKSGEGVPFKQGALCFIRLRK